MRKRIDRILELVASEVLGQLLGAGYWKSYESDEYRCSPIQGLQVGDSVYRWDDVEHEVCVEQVDYVAHGVGFVARARGTRGELIPVSQERFALSCEQCIRVNYEDVSRTLEWLDELAPKAEVLRSQIANAGCTNG